SLCHAEDAAPARGALQKSWRILAWSSRLLLGRFQFLEGLGEPREDVAQLFAEGAQVLPEVAVGVQLLRRRVVGALDVGAVGVLLETQHLVRAQLLEAAVQADDARLQCL